MKKHKSSKKQQTLIGFLFFGVFLSFLLLLIFSLVSAGLIMLRDNPTGIAKSISLVTLLASGAVSGYVIAKKRGEGGRITAFLASLIFCGIILIISLIASKGKISGAILMNCLCYALISGFASFLSKKSKRRHKR